MSDRPGATLLVNPNAEELRGAPGPARVLALDAAENDPGRRALHLLDAAFASIAAGEPRAAISILDRIDDQVDDITARRIEVCRAWTSQIDANLYPGWVGAEFTDAASQAMTTIGAAMSEDPETLLLEAYVAEAPVPLYSMRNTLESSVRMAPVMASQLLPMALGKLEELLAVANRVGQHPTALWALTAQADLAHRCGQTDVAQEALLRARAGFADLGDAVGIVRTLLTEGDWYATPGAYPETLGLDLGVQNLPSPLALERDLERAGDSYERAASLLTNTEAPLAVAATWLREAVVAWLRGDHNAQLELLDVASRESANAGDAAGQHLATIHTFLARIAAGDGPSVRAEAGSGWALRPRGAVANIVSWASERGSVTWCTGLGRLCQRVGEAWEHTGRFDDAESAYLLGVSMLPASGAVSTSSAFAGLISLDKRKNPSRAMVRLDRALVATPSDPEPIGWLQRTELLMSLTQVQIDRAGSSEMGRSLRSMQRTVRLMNGHLATIGVPSAFKPLRTGDGEEALARMLSESMTAKIDNLLDGEDSESGSLALDTGARALASQMRMMRMHSALSDARVALNAGWDAQADVLFRQALDMAEADDESAPWMPALILAAWGKYDQACERIERLRAMGTLPGPILGSLAIRARDFATAQKILPGAEAETWQDMLDRAEVALETGAAEEAANLAAAAMDEYERFAEEMDRDPDLISYVDNVNAGFLYLVAARSWLDIADAAAAAGDQDAARIARIRALSASDRGRSLSMRNLAQERRAVESIRRWRQAGSEWSAAFLRIVEAIDTDAPIEEEDIDELDSAERVLVLAEADLDRSARPAETRRDHDLIASVQADLPDGTCVLSYHAVGTELLTFGFTNAELVCNRTQVGRGELPGLVQRFVEACSLGSGGSERLRLSELLLEPVASVLKVNRRVIVVPFGPLCALPFHALPCGAELLLDSHELSYARSVSTIRTDSIDTAVDVTSAVVVGNPEFDASAHSDLQELPGAGVEAAVVARYLGTDILLSAEGATEAAVREALGGCDVLHVSAHGKLHEAAPPLSSIVLAGRDELTLADLMGMEIPARLVVLSACDSGRGTATLGGDLVGLTRGLMAAGVEHSVVSLWPVDDVTACVTMARFYEELARGVPPATALAHSQRAVRAMTIADIDRAYESLGGRRDSSSRRLRRGHLTRPASASLETIDLDPEFFELDEPDDFAADEPAPTALWAPFILVGG